MRRYKSQAGIVNFSIVLFASLWIITMTVFFLYYAEWQSKKQNIQDYKDINTYLKQKVRRNLNEQIRGIENITGFHIDSENRIDLDKLITNLNNMADSKKEGNDQEKYGVSGLSSPEIFQEKLTITTYSINLEKVLSVYESRIKELQKEDKLLGKSIQVVSDSIDHRRDEYSSIESKYESRVQELTTNKDSLSEKYKNSINNVVAQIDTAKENQKKVKDLRVNQQDNLKKETLKYKNLVSKKMSDIKLLQAQKYGGQKKQISEPKIFRAADERIDGKIVYGNPLSNAVYINLGRNNKVFRGLKFDVFRMAERGEKEYKGRIEVKRVMDKISETIIVDQIDELDPLVNGDILVNPIFSKNRPVYVVFAERNLKKSHIIQLIHDIKEVGGIVEKKITAKTNLVVIDNEKKGQENENYHSAVKFRIPIMDERTLRKYVGDQ